MKKKFALLAFASVFLLSTVIGAQLIVAVAALRTVGVSEGDWAEYACTWSGNSPMMPPPDEKMEWGKMTVQEISGTIITFQGITRYEDHHEETNINVLDVDTGQGNGTGWFIAANLNAGELIYTSPDPDDMFYGMTINETIFRDYLGESVEVNHWNLTESETVPGVGTTTSSINFYWYRATGMLAEASIYMLSQPEVGEPIWMEFEVLIIGIIPEFPPALILPLFMIATIAAVSLGKAIWSNKKSTTKPSPCA